MPKDQFEDDGRTVASMDFDEIGSRYRGRAVRPKIDYKKEASRNCRVKNDTKRTSRIDLCCLFSIDSFCINHVWRYGFIYVTADVFMAINMN